MNIKSLIILISLFVLPSAALAQSQYNCTGPGLDVLASLDIDILDRQELRPSFIRNSPEFTINAFYQGENLKAVTIGYLGESDQEEIKVYFQSNVDYLIHYHKQQNSNFYFENDSVLLREEKSYFHVCDDRLLAPANGGIIDHDLYDKTKYMVDAVLLEINTE